MFPLSTVSLYSLMQFSLPNANPGKKVRLEESSNKISKKTAKLSCVCNLMGS